MKTLRKAFGVLLCLMIAFAFVGCDNNQLTKAPDVSAAALYEKVTTQMLAEEYIGFKVTAKMAQGESTKEARLLQVYLKKTSAGYDIVFETDTYVSTDMGATPKTVTVRSYWIGDTLAIGEYNGFTDKVEYETQTIGTFNAVLTEAGISPDDLTGLVTSDTVIAGSEGGYTVNLDKLDLAAPIKAAIGWVTEHRDNTFGEILTEATGLTKEQIVAGIDNLFADNQTLSALITKLDALLQTLPGDQSLTVETIIDALQAEIGMTTAELIDAINANILQNGGTEDDCLPAPADESLYDYMIAQMGAFPLDMLADVIMNVLIESFGFPPEDVFPEGPQDAYTMSDLGVMLKGFLFSGPTAGDVIGSILAGMDLSGALDMIAVLDIKELSFAGAMQITGSLLTSITGTAVVDIAVKNMTVPAQSSRTEITLRADFSYEQPQVEFKLPATAAAA